MNICIQSLKIWRKFVLPWLKYNIFARGLFFIGAPCTCSTVVVARSSSDGATVSYIVEPRLVHTVSAAAPSLIDILTANVAASNRARQLYKNIYLCYFCFR